MMQDIRYATVSELADYPPEDARKETMIRAGCERCQGRGLMIGGDELVPCPRCSIRRRSMEGM